MKKLNNPILASAIAILIIIIATSLAFLTSPYFRVTEKSEEILWKWRQGSTAKPVASSWDFVGTSTPALEPKTLAPSWQKFEAPAGFIHFSGVVVGKAEKQVRIEYLGATTQPLSPPLIILTDSWEEIPLGALVGAIGYYFQLNGEDYLDTNVIDWRGRRGKIEIVAKSPRK
ncbi:MAG: hypothetical protein AAB451_00540 [Patescibacteria group bacterium]